MSPARRGGVEPPTRPARGADWILGAEYQPEVVRSLWESGATGSGPDPLGVRLLPGVDWVAAALGVPGCRHPTTWTFQGGIRGCAWDSRAPGRDSRFPRVPRWVGWRRIESWVPSLFTPCAGSRPSPPREHLEGHVGSFLKEVEPLGAGGNPRLAVDILDLPAADVGSSPGIPSCLLPPTPGGVSPVAPPDVVLSPPNSKQDNKKGLGDL